MSILLGIVRCAFNSQFPLQPLADCYGSGLSVLGELLLLISIIDIELLQCESYHSP